jgi:hypothetical protein
MVLICLSNFLLQISAKKIQVVLIRLSINITKVSLKSFSLKSPPKSDYDKKAIFGFYRLRFDAATYLEPI